ncbi:hypothetical protein HanRHA438_Chr09g0412401 [Helianthus annuus]|nr:hypothetical protein HanHA300_Chr09g0328781 [Helianthus annuus]KAJ0535522.1 hypothetical protein HanIR_Chr09g0431531 [Helianthus annuus]KAJ0543343.1 hypothetical protein HanHA89_Chr09g0349671 [Helianthus annuus]KAJ0708401.1 hypothetical protein HanLR1_Chr09g0329021 [Helianthus annuus]KAJ0889395.1 hypothetical protein HanRHA438_Chr09g0412401 [Helianthus annuus]
MMFNVVIKKISFVATAFRVPKAGNFGIQFDDECSSNFGFEPARLSSGLLSLKTSNPLNVPSTNRLIENITITRSDLPFLLSPLIVVT